MIKILRKLLPSILCTLLFVVPLKVCAHEMTYDTNSTSNKSEENLKFDQRRLWIDHVWWTRNFIISDFSVSRDRDDVLRRLIKNQEHIGNSIKPYYGDDAGNKLTELLKEHIIIAGKVIDAAKRGNKADLEKSNKLWYDNADKIADFLSQLNTDYDNSILKEMLHKHLGLIKEAATARLGTNWKADIEAFDKGEDHMIKFADILSEGIIKQFPEKFK